MELADFAAKFAVADSTLVDVIGSELLEGTRVIKVKLYKLNVYGVFGGAPCMNHYSHLSTRKGGLFQAAQRHAPQ